MLTFSIDLNLQEKKKHLKQSHAVHSMQNTSSLYTGSRREHDGSASWLRSHPRLGSQSLDMLPFLMATETSSPPCQFLR